MRDSTINANTPTIARLQPSRLVDLSARWPERSPTHWLGLLELDLSRHAHMTSLASSVTGGRTDMIFVSLRVSTISGYRSAQQAGCRTGLSPHPSVSRYLFARCYAASFLVPTCVGEGLLLPHCNRSVSAPVPMDLSPRPAASRDDDDGLAEYFTLAPEIGILAYCSPSMMFNPITKVIVRATAVLLSPKLTLSTHCDMVSHRGQQLLPGQVFRDWEFWSTKRFHPQRAPTTPRFGLSP